MFDYVLIVCRYMGYINDLVRDTPIEPHNRAVMLVSLTLTPVPLFNKLKYVVRYHYLLL